MLPCCASNAIMVIISLISHLSLLTFLVSVFNERKFAPVNFLPGRLHISDGLHHVFVLFTCQLGNLERRHHFLVVVVVSDVRVVQLLFS